jgi:hypothetical protein
LVYRQVRENISKIKYRHNSHDAYHVVSAGLSESPINHIKPVMRTFVIINIPSALLMWVALPKNKINVDFVFRNPIQISNPDVSGMLRFVTDELQAAEDAGQRVWILGHVLPGK